MCVCMCVCIDVKEETGRKDRACRKHDNDKRKGEESGEEENECELLKIEENIIMR